MPYWATRHCLHIGMVLKQPGRFSVRSSRLGQGTETAVSQTTLRGRWAPKTQKGYFGEKGVAGASFEGLNFVRQSVAQNSSIECDPTARFDASR
jgi:hypothetical protein